MAHDKKDQLRVLIKLLDNSDNELYIHLDMKSDIIPDDVVSMAELSRIHVYKKYKIYWGDISQTKCQFFLLEEAVKSTHDYYHLISGTDLPIKSNEYISDFFEKNRGKQFVNFDSFSPSSMENVCFFHPTWYWMNRSRKGAILYKLLCKTDEILVAVQKRMNIRTGLYKGCNWFSITHDFAIDYIKYKNRIMRMIKNVVSPDECAIQCYYQFFNSSWDLYNESHDYKSVMRLIDWEHGNPYVWRINDKDEIIRTEHLFARKFDMEKDKEIIDFIYNYVKNENSVFSSGSY